MNASFKSLFSECTRTDLLRGANFSSRRAVPAACRRRWQAVFLILLVTVTALLPLACPPVARAAPNAVPVIEKTFDHGTLIEHTISTSEGPYRATLRLSQRRRAEGSPAIVHSWLSFHIESSASHPAMPISVFEALLTDLITALHERFGTELSLESLGAASFMGVREIEKQSILAFADYKPWLRYLENPGGFSQMEIHALVGNRWKAMGVFAPVAAVLAPLGYDVVFAGFEKLFVFSAEKCFFYQDLEDLGIRKTDRFPYPGTISFTLTPKR
ncbi:hypothetical protein DSCW_55030 [Desulfosarcina widdelii]|uniref:Uncharacterized protein n=1 Tax=Desulfosarcina widdelii TaxID=947919 RepID=A0A5K7Z8C4_9BACT|nr:hypothetical protein [Desulfosarcina widdelii]BBO78086.1 hypothetical protein DSCW_55030 [Desulfosarcina widdelii]